MNKQEAMILLKYSPNTSDPSAINSALSQKQVVGLIQRIIAAYTDTDKLNSVLELRIFQTVQNRKRPYAVWNTE